MDGTQSFPEIVKLLIENGLQSTLILFFLTLNFWTDSWYDNC